MTDFRNCNIGIVGLGLIGGSFAKAIRAHTKSRVFGYDRDETIATHTDVFAGALTDETLRSCSLLFIALYPEATLGYLRAHLSDIPENCLVIDLCGIKRLVAREAAKLPIRFIGGHPMAGREVSGYDNALPDLFHRASMILTPEEPLAPELKQSLETFFLALGFSRLTIASPEEHDRIIAYTSQLAHILSSSYVKSPTAPDHGGFSAGSFRDLTRVASMNEVMWSELFLENADNLLTEIDRLIERLAEYRSVIAAGDRAGLANLLAEGNEIKKKL